MYNSNTDSLGLILDVEVFFFSGSLFRSTVRVSILWILAVIRDTISNSGTIEYSAAAEEGGEISGERALTLTLDPGHSALNTQGEEWAEGAGPILVNRLDTGPCTRRETQLI